MKVVVLAESELYNIAAELFARNANLAVQERTKFAVVLSGGSTPKRLYELLAQKYCHAIPWKQVHVFFGDERCVPPDHPDSNYRMADLALLSKVDIPAENIHRMKGELPPDIAAAEYCHELADFFELASGEIPSFDMMLLGLGEDGHTASIFPGYDAMDDTVSLVAAPYVHALSAHRLTLTPPVLRRTRNVIFLVTGRAKADVLKQVIEGRYDPHRLPAQLLRTADGEVTWLVEKSIWNETSSKQTEENHGER